MNRTEKRPPAKLGVAAPAKLRPPRLQQVVPRERLFGWLDGHCNSRAAVWLSGPPGAGKTTLIASYLNARSLRCLWYRFDADDNDAGRFFAMLGQAVDECAARSSRPAFAAEHLSRPQAFARAWFRSAFAALPRPLAIVFDNLEQAALASLPALLASAIDEVPDGITLFLTSRAAPPQELAGALMAGQLATLPAAQLEFSALEAAQYANELQLDAAQVARAAQRVNGWAAGLRLLSGADTTSAHAAASPQALFDYFAGLLHDRLSASGQHLLLVGALLPWLPAGLLAGLAGIASTSDAQALLNALCAQHLFIEPVARTPGAYRLHPLWREFLLQRGQRAWPAEMRRALLGEAARAFAARGDTDAAIDLHLDAEDAPGALALLLAVLEDKLALGQLDQWAAWARRLPEAVREHEPRLRYGLARVAFLREDPAAPRHYEQACAGFAAQGDLRGQQLCAAGVLEWSYNTDNFIGHQRWAELLRQPDATDGAAPSEQHTLRLLNGRLLACFFAGDFDAEGAVWGDAVLQRLEPGEAENDKLSAAITLLGCLERHKRWDDALLLAAKMEALLGSPRIGPRLKILARQQIAVDLHRQTGAYAEARRLALEARAQAREHGFGVLEFEAVAVLLYVALYTADETQARKLLGELAAMVDPASNYHQRFAHQMQGWHELQAGHLGAAREHADALRAAIERSDMPARFRATWLQLPIYVSFAEGHVDAALAELTRLCRAAEPGSRAILEANLLCLRAWCSWSEGKCPAARAALAEAFELASGTRYYQLIAPLRNPLAQLAEFALEHRIHPVFTRELIERRRLRPTGPTSPQWPWPLRIATLGRFEIQVNGAALKFDGKVPRKPLTLLKALVAFGGEGVPEHVLTDAVWPDDPGDAAHDAFNVALHRLRKLLAPLGEVLQLREGRLSLDGGACWIDCRAFEELAAVAEPVHDPAVAMVSLHAALHLYQGHFLPSDSDESWSISARERLRSKFNRVVSRCGAALGDAGRHDEALACYQRGIDTDDLAEEFYQGVMRCCLALQRPADGLRTYQRLQRLLSLSLNVAPSARTEALCRELRGR